MKTIRVCVLLLVAFQAGAQTKSIYTNPNFSQLSKNHKLLAILPFRASVKLRPRQMQAMTPEQFNQLQKDEGRAVQSALESYFLKRISSKGIDIAFQPITTTNALLARNNIDEANIETYTPQQVSELLGVDGLMNGLLVTDKPMSDGASLAMGLIVGFYGSTNAGKCTINTYDGASGELLWKYEKTLSRSLGSSTSQVINAMMRKAARKFPYEKP